MATYSPDLQRTMWSPRPGFAPSGTPSPRPQQVDTASEDLEDDQELMEPPLEDTSHMNFVDGRCTCCPYGYHIDLDFLRYLENKNSGSYLTNLKKIHRRKKQLRKSMEVYLHHQETNSTPPPDIVYSTEHFMNIVDQENKVTSQFLEDIDSSVNATLNSIEVMYSDGGRGGTKLSPGANTMNFSEDEADFARSRLEQRYRTEAEMALHSHGLGSISSLESQSTYSSEASPLNSSSSTQQVITTTTVTSIANKSSGFTSLQLANNMANLLPDDEQALANNPNVSPATLQAIREQMAISLQRMKELEEQVKAIPVLQIRINVLKEEKRLLGLQLKAKSSRMNTRTVGVGECRLTDDVAPLSSSLHSRFQTVTNINLAQLGLKSIPNGDVRPPRPAMRSIGVGDGNVFESQLQVASFGGGGGTKYHEKEFHAEQSTEVREKEVKTVFLGQSSDSDANLRLLPPWKSMDRSRKPEKPERPARRTHSIGTGDDDVFGDASSIHVHEKELRTIYISDDKSKKKETRNVGILCKAAVRDVGVTYMYELEKPSTRNIAIGVGEIGVGEGYFAEGEGALMTNSSHITHMALQQMNLAAFHQQHIHINNEQLLAVLDTYLKKDLTSVSTQCTFSTVDQAIQHTVDLTVRTSVGCGTDSIDVEVKPKVLMKSVGIENRPLCMNRLVGTDRGFMLDVSTNTFPQMITKTRATNTDQVIMYPAAVNTDRAVQYSTSTETETFMFESMEAVRSVGMNTSANEVTTRATNTESMKHLSYHNFDFDITFSNKGVNTEVTSGRKNVYDRGVNTDPPRLFQKGTNTQAVRLVDRAVNVTKGYMPSTAVQTEVNTVTRAVGDLPIHMPSHSTGTGDMPINECENCHNRWERMRPVAVNTDRILMKSVGVGYQSIREVGHISEATSDVYVSKLSPKSPDLGVSAADNDVSNYQQESRTVKTVTMSTGQSLGNEKGGNVVIERTIIRGGAAGAGAGGDSVTTTDVQRLSGTSDDFEARLGRISSKNVTTEEMMLGGEETSTTGFDGEVTTITSSTRSQSTGGSGLHGRSIVVERDGAAAGSSHDGAVVHEESHETIRGRPMQIVRHIETSYVGGHPVNKTSRVVVHGKEDQHHAEGFQEFQESSSSGQTSSGTLALDGMGGMTESSSSGQTSSGILSLGGMGGMTESSSSRQTSSGMLSVGGMGGMTESSSSRQTSSGTLSVGGMGGMRESSSSGQTSSGTLSVGGMGGMTESSSSGHTSSGTLSVGGMGGMTESSSSGHTSSGTLSVGGMGMTRHLAQGFALNEGHVQSGNVEYTSSIQPRTKGRKVVITETRIERKLTGRPGRTVTTTTTTTESSDNNGALRSIMKQPGNDLSDLKTKKEISFSEDVIGGYVSTSSDEDDVQEHATREGEGEQQPEEGGSESEGSQSSISFDEGSYDGRAGKIVYTCRDDEAIAQGVPGARMYEESVTESYELNAEVASSCEIYAQWLVDSTQITTKQLNSALALIQHEWFKVSSTKTSNPAMVEGFLTCLNDFSSELMQHVVNLADANGNTALHYAVSHCNMEIVNLLLDTQSIDVNKQNKAGYTAIMLASLAQVTTDRQREIISKMFSMGDVNARASQAGQTALMLAVSHGRQNMVQMLLEAGAKVNMQDEDGSTALMCASEHGHTDIVKMLLGQPDCDPTIQDNDGSTALSIAMEAGHRDIGVLLYAHVNFKQGSPILGRGKGKRRTPTGSSSSLSSSSSLTRR